MILVTRINGTDQFYINEDRIEFLEATPDTMITLESGKKVVVKESVDEVVRRIAKRKAEQYYFRNSGLCESPPGREGTE